MPNCKNPSAMGKGELLRSAPRNRSAFGGSETVPCRKARTYGGGVFGVTPDSDVTHVTKALTNAGATAASGLVPGA